MKKILFVEDNEVLRQLYNVMLENESDRWQVATASSGEAAMQLLKQAAFDVVVSDMQMPGMDGVELLKEVRKLHPQTSRIIVSGSCDQAMAADSLNSTHLFIPKPVDVKTLKATLARIGSLDAYLKNDDLRGLAAKMRDLPSFPTLYLEVIQEIESPYSSIENIARIVSHDPGISTKILRVANSAAYGFAEPVCDLTTAVLQLGMSSIRSIVLSAQVYSSFASNCHGKFSADALWSHLMDCGGMARAIMRRERAQLPEHDDAFTAGLLHDMGKLMLADSLPAEFEKALYLADSEGMLLHEAEQEIFGATHCGLAAYLLGLWGLPASIVEAVAFHHQPENSDLKKFSVLTAVHVANALAYEKAGRPAPLDMNYLEKIGVSDRLDDWREVIDFPDESVA